MSRKQTHIENEINLIMAELALLKPKQEQLERQMKDAVDKATQSFTAQLTSLSESINAKEKDLIAKVKKAKKELFKDADIKSLPNGRLIYKVSLKVKRAKGILKALLRLNKTQAVIIDQKVNWDELEKWTDQQLSEIGTERKKKEQFEYELC